MKLFLLCSCLTVMLIVSCSKMPYIDNESFIEGKWIVNDIVSQSGSLNYPGPKDTVTYKVPPDSLKLPKPYLDFEDNGKLYILEEFPILSGSNWYTYTDTTTYQISGNNIITPAVLTGIFLTSSNTLEIQSLSSNYLTIYINQPPSNPSDTLRRQYWYNLTKQ
jgi:hypothetical protein